MTRAKPARSAMHSKPTWEGGRRKRSADRGRRAWQQGCARWQRTPHDPLAAAQPRSPKPLTEQMRTAAQRLVDTANNAVIVAQIQQPTAMTVLRGMKWPAQECEHMHAASINLLAPAASLRCLKT